MTQPRKNWWKSLAEKTGAVLFAILLWQVAAMILKSSLLASPVDTAGRLLTLATEPDFWGAIAFSFLRIVSGFLLSLLWGICLAVASGKFRLVELALWPFISVIKSTPVASFIILCLIWLNSRNLSVFISFLMVLPIVYTNTLQGIKSADQNLLEMAQVFRVPAWKKVLYLYLPQLKPYLLSACSVSLGLSWKAGIAAEVIGIPGGSIGEKLYQAKVYLSSPDLFAWTVVIIAISILFEKLFLLLLTGLYRLLEGEREKRRKRA